MLIDRQTTKPIVFLQSFCSPTLASITLPVLAVDASFRMMIGPDDLHGLELPPDRQPDLRTDVLCLAIFTLAEASLATPDLLAPLVVSLKTNTAFPAIQIDTAYSHQHPLSVQNPEEAECS